MTGLGAGQAAVRRARVAPKAAAGQLAALAVRTRVTAAQAPAARVAGSASRVTAAQAPAIAVLAQTRPARTVAPARLRPRPEATPVPAGRGISPRDRLLTGTQVQVVGHKRSGLRRRETAVARLRAAGGTGRRHDVTAQLLRGGSVPVLAETSNRRTLPISDRSRARSAARPLPAAASGLGRPGRRGKNRPAAPAEGTPVGPGGLPRLRVPRVRRRTAGRRTPRATNGRYPPGEAKAVLASPWAAAVVCPRARASAAPHVPAASSVATRSRVVRQYVNCSLRTGGKCTRSG